jgi:chromosome segregation protein
LRIIPNCSCSRYQFIVGPNGCGKSNVVDAVRWVLGEANIRHLRGKRNEDVIFNGSDKKKGLGMALVEMVVDNSDHSLPVEYEELCLSRKIYRSGESEYYINKSRVRLKDIVKLFTGTGLGQKGYSIISQGELEQVLNGQPFERRLMLEEASGIIKYRQQRDEVRARLQSSSQDLLRLQDILSELETRQADLHLKAEKARRYLDMNNEATDMEKQLLAWEIRENHKNLAARREEIEKHKNELARMTEALEEINSAWQLQNKILEEQRVLQADLKEQKHSCETALKSMESEIGLCQSE